VEHRLAPAGRNIAADIDDPDLQVVSSVVSANQATSLRSASLMAASGSTAH